MKKIYIILFALLFFFSEASSVKASVSKTDLSLSPSPTEYNLPYPGILPDSPLYFFKVLRDKIGSFFISDPIKKAEFNIACADTRLAAARSLIEKKNIVLAEEVISKAENYLEEAILKDKEAKIQGMPVGDLSRKVVNASRGYGKIIEEIESQLDKKNRKKIEIVKRRSQKLQKIAESM